MLLTVNDGVVPADRVTLQALPDVGRKTANVVWNEAFDQPTVTVDTHIFRLGNHTSVAEGKRRMQSKLNYCAGCQTNGKKWALHWLILHGRYVCKAHKPECGACVIRDLCLFRDKTDRGRCVCHNWAALFCIDLSLFTDFVQRMFAGGLVKLASQKRATHIGVCRGERSDLVIKKEINHTI